MRALVLLPLLASCHREPEVMVAAAASLRPALPELAAAFHERGPAVTAVYGASGDLRKRVEDGAPIDAVLFAAPEPVDRLVADGRADRASRRVFAYNRLVLVAPRGARASLDRLGDGDKIAIGDPDSVPAGAYAKRWLLAAGRWDALRGRLVFAGDVTAVLTYVRRGEVAAGFVYASDAQGAADVERVPLPGPEPPRTELVAAVIEDGAHAAPAAAFVAFLTTPPAQRILAAHGFEPASGGP